MVRPRISCGDRNGWACCKVSTVYLFLLFWITKVVYFHSKMTTSDPQVYILQTHFLVVVLV